MNGGKCEVNLETNKPSCLCSVNFYGEKCEKKSEFGMFYLFIFFLDFNYNNYD